jgi:hypothetical protein
MEKAGDLLNNSKLEERGQERREAKGAFNDSY